MAKVQRYMENNNPEHYSEGPYVLIAHPMGLGFRIERYNPEAECATFDPRGSDIHLMQAYGLKPGWHSMEKLSPIVDALNYNAKQAGWTGVLL